MATFKEDFVGKYQTTTDGDIEETNFSEGDEVEIVDTWSNHVLVKDDDDHYYNVPKDIIEE